MKTVQELTSALMAKSSKAAVIFMSVKTTRKCGKDFGESGKKETKIQKDTQSQRERLGKLFIRKDMNQRDTDLQILVYKIITNMKSSILQQNGQN